MLIFVASNGKSLEVPVEPSTRISAIMEALVGATTIRPSDQILICNGTRLEAAKELGAYNLPGPDGSNIRDVFLYNKSDLRLHGGEPPAEKEKPLSTPDGAVDGEEAPPHVLDEASSPLVRALPQYERQFKRHFKVAHTVLQASQERGQHCSALVSEMEVQSRAIDSARTNVETHYHYIHNHVLSFLQQYSVQRKTHTGILAGFEQQLEALAAVELHPAAQLADQTHLIHLVNAPQLRDWATACAAFHQNLALKVNGVEELFIGLKADVEAVFMQAPTVQLEALAMQLHAMMPHLEEIASIVQVLETDLQRIQKHVGTAAQQSGAASVTAYDSFQLMETMRDNHDSELLPRIEHYRAMFEGFYQRCLSCKNQMTKDVVTQLQKISSQQMKIQSMRDKLAIFREAAAKEDDMFAKLLLVRRIPAAYRQCLAECMRRRAFSDVYTGKAQQVAEHMGKLREKEQDKRRTFLKQMQEYIPMQLLAALGLTQQPPHCQISLPPLPGIPNISTMDVQKVPLLSDPAASASTLLPFGSGAAAGAAYSGASPKEPSTPQEEAAEAPSAGQALEMENARLRAELAMCMAQECMQRLASSPLDHGEGIPCEGGGHGPQRIPSAAAELLPASDVRKFQAAISAKQELVLSLERHLTQARQQVATYESRIHDLEALLSKPAAKLRGRESPGRYMARSASASSTSSSGIMPTVAEGSEDPVPLALTPVLASPARSASPAPPASAVMPPSKRPSAADQGESSSASYSDGRSLEEISQLNMQRGVMHSSRESGEAPGLGHGTNVDQDLLSRNLAGEGGEGPGCLVQEGVTLQLEHQSDDSVTVCLNVAR